MTKQELRDIIHYEGGTTFKDGFRVEHYSGYQVGILYDTIEYEYNDEGLESLLVAIKDGALQDGGIWYNLNTKMIDVDLLTVQVSNKMDALNLAKHFNQKAIFDWRASESIYLEE